MNNQRIRVLFSFTLFLLDALLIALAFVCAYYLRVLIPWPDPIATQAPLSAYAGLLVLQVGGIITVLSINGQYFLPRAPSRIDQFYAVIIGASFGTVLAVATSTFLFKGNAFIVDYPRAMIVYAWALSILFLVIGRILYQSVRGRLRKRGIGKDRLLIVGTGEVAQIIIRRIQWSPQLGYEIVGVVDDGSGMRKLRGVPVLGDIEHLPDLIDRHRVDEVMIAVPERGHRETVRIISYCQRERVSIKIFPDLFQFITSEAGIDDLGGLPLLSVRDYNLRGYLLVFKRLIDLAGAGIGLILLSPLMLAVAIAIKFDSPGPVFFVQERMGLDGKPFKMIKFRSMRQDAERDGPGWTVQDDPRRTRLGSFIRKVNVDELPQLINVMLGEMSLVGPRPEQPRYVEEFRKSVPDYMLRHREKAGMTGWAQVNGLRGDTSIMERTKYDIWYIENWSPLLDVKIIVRTVWQTVVGRNFGAG